MKYCAKCKRIKIFDFCIFCFKKTANSFVLKAGTGNFEYTINKTKLTHRRPEVKRFLKQVIIGWMPTRGRNSKKYSKGVFVRRVIDRENDWYEEEIIDRKTNNLIEFKKEPLSGHKFKG